MALLAGLPWGINHRLVDDGPDSHIFYFSDELPVLKVKTNYYAHIYFIL